MKKITLAMCHVHTKIRRVGEADTDIVPCGVEIQNYPHAMTLAVEVSWGGFHATSKRLPYEEGLQQQKELSESAFIWLIRDLRQTRDLLAQYDLSNEL